MQRGEVFELKAPRRPRGHEQQAGSRFGVIIQADELLPLSTVIVAPTSTAAPKRSFRPEVEIGGTRARVLVEQLGAVDRSWLGTSQGVLTRPELEDADRALAVVLGLV